MLSKPFFFLGGGGGGVNLIHINTVWRTDLIYLLFMYMIIFDVFYLLIDIQLYFSYLLSIDYIYIMFFSFVTQVIFVLNKYSYFSFKPFKLSLYC